MIQDQLVDYVSSQMKLGVSRDAIKSALVSAGWVAGDVEDTIKKIEGSGGAPMQSSVKSTAAGAASATAVVKTSDPQMIRVSDLVSSTSPASVTNINTKSAVSSMGAAKPDAAKTAEGKISGNSFEAASSSGSKKGMIMGIIAVIIILGLGGVAWYFYSGNADLASKVASLTAQSAAVNTQLTTLQSQLDASSTGYATQLASLTAANADLALNLSFYAAPLGGSSSSTTAAALPVTISGWLSGGGKGAYAITTPRGAKVFVANSADPKISLLLKPIVGHTVQAIGDYVPGSDAMTVTSVTDLTPPVATTTATTTPSSTPAATSASSSAPAAAATSTTSSTSPASPSGSTGGN